MINLIEKIIIFKIFKLHKIHDLFQPQISLKITNFRNILHPT